MENEMAREWVARERRAAEEGMSNHRFHRWTRMPEKQNRNICVKTSYLCESVLTRDQEVLVSRKKGQAPVNCT